MIKFLTKLKVVDSNHGVTIELDGQPLFGCCATEDEIDNHAAILLSDLNEIVNLMKTRLSQPKGIFDE